jgi:hypothetical protein
VEYKKNNMIGFIEINGYAALTIDGELLKGQTLLVSHMNYLKCHLIIDTRLKGSRKKIRLLKKLKNKFKNKFHVCLKVRQTNQNLGKIGFIIEKYNRKAI